MTDNLEIRVTTVQFTKDGASILAHSQVLPPATAEGEPQYRWSFNTMQLASSNGLSSQDLPPEYTAETDSERDELAEKLLDAILTARKKADELMAQVNEAFSSSLPQSLTGQNDGGPTPE